MGKYHILIVDDDAKILKLLKDFLQKNEYLVSTAPNAEIAANLLEEFIFDLIILDVMLPEVTGFEFAQKIRSAGINMPIVMLTALFASHDRVKGLESGASDYLTKPFEPKELLIRIHNLIKIDKKNSDTDFVKYFGNNSYNSKTKEFFKGGLRISLSSSEEKLLDYLITLNSQIISRESLIKELGLINERSVDVQIARLRGKIENNAKDPRFLKTVRNEGYALYI